MRKNKIIIIFGLIMQAFISIAQSVALFARHLGGSKKVSPLKENRFLDVLNFILHTGPKSFWKKPNGIKIGRSIATLIHYIFNKDERFKEIRK